LWKKFAVRVPGDHIWEQGRQRFNLQGELGDMKRVSLSWHPYLIFLRFLQYFVVRFANLVVVPSAYMQQIAISWGAVPTRVHVVYSSINFNVEPLLPKERPQGFLVVTIARPVPWKGLEGLARVVKREAGWSLKIVDGLPRAEALGWVKAADVFVINSTYEGLSHALIEAMSLGTPIVATNVGGNPELITNSVSGLLIVPIDDDSLYAALKDVEHNREVAHARAEAARATLQKFSIDTTISQIANLLQSI
jgi:glycosyltransferase involved in cell wall biosynthesis